MNSNSGSLLSSSSESISTTLSISSEKYSKEFSDVDLNIQIHNERIQAIISETIFKTEIIIFVLNCDDFHDLQEVNELVPEEILSEIKIFSSKSIWEKSVLETIDYRNITTSQIQEIIIYPLTRVDPEISQLICKISDVPDIMQLIKSKIRDLRQTIQTDNLELSNIMTYLDSLIKLRIKFKSKLSISAAEKLKREILARNLNKTNKALKLKINDSSKKLNQEKENFKESFEEKENLIKGLQEKLDTIKNNCKDDITKILFETENEMDVMKECHKSKMNILKEKEDEIKEHLECLLRENLDNENCFRIARRKVEKELLYWLAQYDKEVGYRQAVLDDLTQLYETKQRRYEELQETLSIQEKTYTPLMAQKEEEYQKEILNKMTTFLMEHAARVIQREWRKILNARAEKKRLKKLASKKKKIKDSSVAAIPI